MSNSLNRPRVPGLSRRHFMFGGLSSLSAGAVILGGCVPARSPMPGSLQPVAIPLVPAPFDAPAPFTFETVTTDELGQIVSRTSKQGRYFTELLEPPKLFGIVPHIRPQPKIPLAMIEIPAGEFMMGSPENEKTRDRAEGPQHRVKVARFFMGRFEVTETQWHSLMDDEKILFSKGENFPVGSIGWTSAQRFCRKLSEQTGRNYRLPSEAEWEYACRAGTTTPFYDGLTAARSVASNASFGEKLNSYKVPVGCFPANAFGLHDLHGNAWEWEWCADHWHDNYQGAPTDGSAWVDPVEPFVPLRVARGGTYSDGSGYDWPSWSVRSAVRCEKQLSVGSACFRVVCSA